MGYYTYYKLEISPRYTKEEELKLTLDIAKFFGLRDEVTINTHFDDFLEEEIKWYDHEENMIELSEKYPNYLFTLSGEGEESGDIWRTYFKNGKCQRVEAKIVFDECNL